MPVGAPALSLHVSAAVMSSRKSAVVPTIASELAHAFTASTEPWNNPGRSDNPVSAITLTVIVLGLTPTSLAVSVVVLQTSDVVSVGCVLVVSPPSPIFLPLLHADKISTMTSRTPTQPKRLKIPPHLPAARRSDGPSDWKVRACLALALSRKLYVLVALAATGLI